MFSLSKPLCSFCRIAAFRPKPVRLQPKGLLQNENARANRTRNSKRAIKIVPREKRFCFSPGPIFVHISCKAIMQQPLYVLFSRRTRSFLFGKMNVKLREWNFNSNLVKLLFHTTLHRLVRIPVVFYFAPDLYHNSNRTVSVFPNSNERNRILFDLLLLFAQAR